MTTKSQHTEIPAAGAAPDIVQDTASGRPPARPDRACCCPARPMVVVMLPPTATRARPADLWLCGHHYRASQAALTQADAVVSDAPGRD